MSKKKSKIHHPKEAEERGLDLNDGQDANPAKKKKLSNKVYEEELAKLHVELVHLQEWIKHKRLKVVVIFEGMLLEKEVLSSGSNSLSIRGYAG